MGGKGGGGDTGGNVDRATWAKDTAQHYYNLNPTGMRGATDTTLTFKDEMENNRRNYVNPTTGVWDEAAWRQNKGGAGFDWSRNLFDLYYPTPAAPAPAPAPAPAAAVPAPEAPAPVAPPPAAPPGGTPIDPGGAIDQPGSTGEQLGGAVLNPPAYWVGGLDSYSKAKGTGGTKGSLTTTQT